MNSFGVSPAYYPDHKLVLVSSMVLGQPVHPLLLFAIKDNHQLPDALFYDVFTNIAELHLSQVKISMTWSDVFVGDETEEESRWKRSREYFSLPLYRLPVGKLVEP